MSLGVAVSALGHFGSGLIECLGFSSGPIRMVFMLFDALTTKAINFLRDGSGPLGFVLRPWVGLIGLLVRVLEGLSWF